MLLLMVKLTALTETHTNDKAELEGRIQAVDAKFIAASEEQNRQQLFA